MEGTYGLLACALGVLGYKMAFRSAISRWTYGAFGCACLAVYFSRPHSHEVSPPSADNAILITGAAGGIGQHAALALVNAGYFVFAGVRKQADGDELLRLASNPALMQIVILDVTNKAHIEATVKTIQESGKHLVALVNNAGKVAFGPMEISNAQLEDIMTVNFFGPVYLTNALLPQLRAAKGRVVFVSSLAGEVSGLANGVYCASKFALEAGAEAYRQELLLQNMAVSVVQPGFIDTPMPRGVAKNLTSWRANFPGVPTEVLDVYEHPMEAYSKAFIEMLDVIAGSVTSTTAAIVHAITSTHPRTRYLVGYDANIVSRLRWLMPDAFYDRFGAATMKL